MSRTEITFRVFGDTHDEIDRQAREELARYAGDPDRWGFAIDATAIQKVDGKVIGYDATVTAWTVK